MVLRQRLLNEENEERTRGIPLHFTESELEHGSGQRQENWDDGEISSRGKD